MIMCCCTPDTDDTATQALSVNNDVDFGMCLILSSWFAHARRRAALERGEQRAGSAPGSLERGYRSPWVLILSQPARPPKDHPSITLVSLKRRWFFCSCFWFCCCRCFAC